MGQMVSAAEHISVTERVAAEAEMDSVKMKKLEFFQRQLEARDPQVFRATIIDVRNYGLLLELPDVLLTGLVHVSSLTDDFYVFHPAQRRFIGRQSRRRFSSLTDDFYVFHPAQRRFIGRQSRRRFSVGDQLRVFVARVDIFKRQVDFAIANGTAPRQERARRDHRPARTHRR